MTRLFAAALAMAATPALAHHPLRGMPMETFTHGLLSGIGHPILGFDHLFFIVAMGVAALFTGVRYVAPAVCVAAMLVGCGLMYVGAGLPIKEAMIALSLLVVGGILISGKALGGVAAIALFTGFGLFHGSAFGDSIAAQEGGVGGGVLLGYLIGLAVIQYLIAVGAGWVAKQGLGVARANAVNSRLIGAAVAGVGLFLTLESFESSVFALLFNA